MKEEAPMRRLVITIPLAVAGLTAAIVLAAVTWHSGPTFTHSPGSDGILNTFDDTFTATGDGSGFGNQPAVATIALKGTVRYTCQNNGGNQAPGQNPVPASTTGSQDLGNADHNGRGVLNLTVGPIAASATVSGKTAGCPNENWSGINPVFQGSRTATLTITQAGKTIFGPVTINY
jgi:hypothetical protein